ncbi:hypothetical protein BJ508DRAFT_340417 [Ascobolus immersus RN42]|uniref:Uncharacterized protein n=1 Tax=Ascobolus immersus RN42 TaxID=1160509 RepID=A0A3N4IF68_ASCIM|nr:hypothetical protein BJ508DRAFT_340417 [Ascobolus immersus RN42]
MAEHISTDKDYRADNELSSSDPAKRNLPDEPEAPPPDPADPAKPPSTFTKIFQTVFGAASKPKEAIANGGTAAKDDPEAIFNELLSQVETMKKPSSDPSDPSNPSKPPSTNGASSDPENRKSGNGSEVFPSSLPSKSSSEGSLEHTPEFIPDWSAASSSDIETSEEPRIATVSTPALTRPNLLTQIIGPHPLLTDLKATAYAYIPLPPPLAPTPSISRLIADEPEPPSTPDPLFEDPLLEPTETALYPHKFTLTATEVGPFFNPPLPFTLPPLHTSFANIPSQHIRDDFLDPIYRLLISRLDRDDILFLPTAFHSTLHHLAPNEALPDYLIMELLYPGGTQLEECEVRRYWGAIQNVQGAHWVWSVYDRERREVWVWDSLNGEYGTGEERAEVTRWVQRLAGQPQGVREHPFLQALGLDGSLAEPDTDDDEGGQQVRIVGKLDSGTVRRVRVRRVEVVRQEDGNTCGLHALANMGMFLELMEGMMEEEVEGVFGEERMVHDDAWADGVGEGRLRGRMVGVFEEAKLYESRDLWKKVEAEAEEMEVEEEEGRVRALRDPTPYIGYVFGQTGFEAALPRLQRSVARIKAVNRPCAVVVDIGTGSSGEAEDYDIVALGVREQVSLYRTYHHPLEATIPEGIPFLNTTHPHEFRDFRNLRPGEQHNFEAFEAHEFDVALQAQMRSVRGILGNDSLLALPVEEYNQLPLNVLLRRTAKSGYMGRRVKDHRTCARNEKPYEWGIWVNGQRVEGGQIIGPLGEWAVVGVDGAYFLYMRGPGVEPYRLGEVPVREVERDASLRAPGCWAWEEEMTERRYNSPAEVGRREREVLARLAGYRRAWEEVKRGEERGAGERVGRREVRERRMLGGSEEERERAMKLQMLRELRKWREERRGTNRVMEAMERDNLAMLVAKKNAEAKYKLAVEEGAKTKLELEKQIKKTEKELEGIRRRREEKSEELKDTQDILQNVLEERRKTPPKADTQDKEAYEKEKQMYQQRIDGLTEEMLFLEADKSRLMIELETLQTDHSKCEENITSLQNRLDESKKDADEATKEELSARTQLLTTEADLTAANNLLENTKSQLSQLKADLERERHGEDVEMVDEQEKVEDVEME